MNLLALVLVLVSQVAQVGGQVLLKKGMTPSKARRRKRIVALYLGAGVALLTVWFLLWMGLHEKLELSYLFPFQGISPVLLVIAAAFLLREKTNWRTWAGVALISLGTVLVAMTGKN
ncbi:MAG: EamA family transporter [Planctomycetaceae bacterium]|nr:EamA family transporter [Planctomycetaceae bacterium]